MGFFSRKTRPATSGRSPSRTFRPRLELMEDRTVPSASFASAFSLGSTGGDMGKAITADAAGNTYLTGFFQKTVDFDPAHVNPAAILTSPSYINSTGGTSYSEGAFMAKYLADGTFAWARAFGAGSGEGVAVDKNGNGNVYVTGAFSGTVDFGSLAQPALLTAQGSSDAFVAKLDTTGNVLWARQLGGVYGDSGNGVAVDGAGNAFITGTTDKLGTSLNADYDVFVAKFDSGGNLAWNNQVGGSGYDQASRVAVDGAGNVVAVGSFRGSVDFDPGSGSYTLSSGGRSVQPSEAAFVLKLNASGGFVWADAFQAGMYSGSRAYDLAVDTSNNIYVTGSFSGTVDFDPGKGKLTLPNAGGSDVFVVKLDAAGKLAWGKSMGGPNNDDYNGGGIALDSVGNVYVTGSFGLGAGNHDTATFGSTTLTSAGDRDIFVTKLDSQGNFLWAVSMGGPGADSATSIAVDGSGNIYTTGFYGDSSMWADFDPSAAQYLLTSAGNYDIFVSKLKQV